MTDDISNDKRQEKSSQQLIEESYAAINTPGVKPSQPYALATQTSQPYPSAPQAAQPYAPTGKPSSPEAPPYATSSQPYTPKGSPVVPKKQTATPAQKRKQGWITILIFWVIVAIVVFGAGPLIIESLEESPSSSTNNYDSSTSSDYNAYLESFETIDTELVRNGNEINGFVDLPNSFALESSGEDESPVYQTTFVDNDTGCRVILKLYPEDAGMTQRAYADFALDSINSLDRGYATLYIDEYSTPEISGTIHQIYSSVVGGDISTEFFFTTADGRIRSMMFSTPADKYVDYLYDDGTYLNTPGDYQQTFSVVDMIYSFSLKS